MPVGADRDAGGREACEVVLRVGPVPGYSSCKGREHGHTRDQHYHDRGPHGHAVVADAVDGQPPRALALDHPASVAGPGGPGCHRSEHLIFPAPRGPPAEPTSISSWAPLGHLFKAERPGQPDLDRRGGRQLLPVRQREVARCLVAGGVGELGLEPRLFYFAKLLGLGAAGWNLQPLGGLIGEGSSPGGGGAHPPVSLVRVRRGDRRLEDLAVGVARPGVEVLAVGHLDDLADVHDGNPVAHVADHRQVVGDEHVSGAPARP